MVCKRKFSFFNLLTFGALVTSHALVGTSGFADNSDLNIFFCVMRALICCDLYFFADFALIIINAIQKNSFAKCVSELRNRAIDQSAAFIAFEEAIARSLTGRCLIAVKSLIERLGEIEVVVSGKNRFCAENEITRSAVAFLFAGFLTSCFLGYAVLNVRMITNVSNISGRRGIHSNGCTIFRNNVTAYVDLRLAKPRIVLQHLRKIQIGANMYIPTV